MDAMHAIGVRWVANMSAVAGDGDELASWPEIV